MRSIMIMACMISMQSALGMNDDEKQIKEAHEQDMQRARAVFRKIKLPQDKTLSSAVLKKLIDDASANMTSSDLAKEKLYLQNEGFVEPKKEDPHSTNHTWSTLLLGKKNDASNINESNNNNMNSM